MANKNHISDDYDRAQDYLESQIDIDEWEELNGLERTMKIRDLFYKTKDSGAKRASEKLRIAIDQRRQGETAKITIAQFVRRNKKVTMVRDAKGRFKKQVK